MRTSLLLSLMLLTSCGKQFDLSHDIQKHEDPRPMLTTSPVFIKYIDMFESEYGQTIGDIPINFGIMEKATWAAVCLEWDSGERSIEVSTTHWDTLSEEQKQDLIFHELGHCELGLDHDDTFNDEDSCPNSLMYPNIFGEHTINNCFKPKFDQYMRQLFKR